MANSPAPVRNWRNLVRLLNRWPLSSPSPCISNAALKTRGLSRISRRTPSRTSNLERTHSEKLITPRKKNSISVTAKSVNPLWPVITLSKICNIYSVGVSISRLTSAVKPRA